MLIDHRVMLGTAPAQQPQVYQLASWSSMLVCPAPVNELAWGIDLRLLCGAVSEKPVALWDRPRRVLLVAVSGIVALGAVVRVPGLPRVSTWSLIGHPPRRI